MKIIKNNNLTKLEIETSEGFSAFRMGLEDRRQWNRHPETIELANYLNNNTRTEYIYASYGDANIRIK